MQFHHVAYEWSFLKRYYFSFSRCHIYFDIMLFKGNFKSSFLYTVTSDLIVNSQYFS